MSAEVIDLAAERIRRADPQPPTEAPDWNNTDRGRAARVLLMAMVEIKKDEIFDAFRHAREACAILERLDGGVTLEQDLARLEARKRRMARGAKAAETRRRNKKARERLAGATLPPAG